MTVTGSILDASLMPAFSYLDSQLDFNLNAFNLIAFHLIVYLNVYLIVYLIVTLITNVPKIPAFST